MKKKKIGVLTGGGDTSALNAILKGIAIQADKYGWELIGFIKGWEGLLKGGEYIILAPETIDENRGGTLLKTSRKNLQADDIEQALDKLQKLDTSGLIVIGGDDTLTAGVRLSKQCAQTCPVTFVTKTIDNDVGNNAPPGEVVDYTKIINYFCPGFPTAASRLAQFTLDLRTTAYSHERIMVIEAMGRDTGWLALAAAYGHPDFIIIPEVPLNYENLKEKIAQRFQQQKQVIMVIAEAVKYQDGVSIKNDPSYLDPHGNPKLGGCSEVVATRLKTDLSAELRTENFNSVIPGYLQRCGSPIPLDRDCAIALGRKAVKTLAEGKEAHVTCIMWTDSGFEATTLLKKDVLAEDAEGKVRRRNVDSRFYDADTYSITPAGIKYLKPILGEFQQPINQWC